VIFPQYRRASNGRHFYRIEGPRSFTEVHLIGSRAVIHRVRDAAYPEQVRIRGMLAMEQDAYQELPEADFLRVLDMHDGR
jgi:hypothetical protein